jgi:hypothetical protein
MAAALGHLIQAECAVMDQRHLPRRRQLAAAEQPHSRDRLVRARDGRAVTNAVRAPVRAAVRGMHVVLRASASVMAGSMLVRRRTTIGVLAPRGARRRA